jgi:D-arabinose 1-dehydrogenase-like Zn-dependent alcohol dehydrogenase
MRAAVITKFKEPWELRELPDPHPGPGQVVISVRASGLCYTDLHAHHGAFPLPTPFVAGHEPAGVILEVGAGVTDLQVGDRVGVFWNQKGCDMRTVAARRRAGCSWAEATPSGCWPGPRAAP